MTSVSDENFSWLRTRSHPDVPDGTYAGASFDQHSLGWCGCCYIVAVVQAVEDRAHIALPHMPRSFIDMQAVVDHFNHSQGRWEDDWNACHGGYPLHVGECLVSGVCPVRVSTAAPRRWFGHPSRTDRTPLSNVPFRVTHVERMATADVREELFRRGPVVLEISGETIKSTDRAGVVTDQTPRPANHAVSVVGWTTTHAGLAWIVRNSWGRNRVPRAIPDDVHCVNEDGNRCEVEWEYWVGDPDASGFCYLPMSHPTLHTSDPWIVPHIAPTGARLTPPR